MIRLIFSYESFHCNLPAAADCTATVESQQYRTVVYPCAGKGGGARGAQAQAPHIKFALVCFTEKLCVKKRSDVSVVVHL